jgi:hypothetical protein
MVDRDPVDVVLQIFEWASGLLSTISLGIAGMLLTQRNAERLRMEERFDKFAKDIMEGDGAIWNAFRDEQRTSGAFRERIAEAMITKADLREVERRLSALIQSESRGRRVPASEDQG